MAPFETPISQYADHAAILGPQRSFTTKGTKHTKDEGHEGTTQTKGTLHEARLRTSTPSHAAPLAKSLNMMRTLVLLLAAALLVPQGVPVTKPQFVDGLAQPVFADQAVIRHNVWVEVPNLDTRSRRRERSDARADLAAGRNGCRREAADRARGQPVQRRHAAVSAARHHRAAYVPRHARTPSRAP